MEISGFQLTSTDWDKLSQVIVKVVDTRVDVPTKFPTILYLLPPNGWTCKPVSQVVPPVTTGVTPRLEYTVQISIPLATEVVWFVPYKLNTLLDIVIRCWASATMQGKSASSSVNSTFKAFDGAKLIASVTLVYPGPFTLTTVMI